MSRERTAESTCAKTNTVNSDEYRRLDLKLLFVECAALTIHSRKSVSSLRSRALIEFGGQQGSTGSAVADGAGESTATGTPWLLGVRARLLLAFFGISAFAALAAAAGIYAFREVGGRLDIVETRVAPTISSLELSHSAERIIATAPALLAAADRTRRDEIKAGLEAELAQLNAKLLDLKRSGAADLPLQEIEPVVASLTSNLAALEDLVARRLEASERIAVLRRSVFQTSDETQRLLAPWLEVMDKQISSLMQDLRNARAGPDGPERLAVLIELQRQTQAGQRQVSSAVDMLAEASTTEQVRRLPVLAFQLGLALRDLAATAVGLDPKLRPPFLEQVGKLRELSHRTAGHRRSAHTGVGAHRGGRAATG